MYSGIALANASALVMIRPPRALLHPLFGVALAVLALNDHVLKSARVLPAFVTGKASDFAGLLVAQVVLTVIARARSRRAFAWITALLAAGFVALKTSSAVSTIYERALFFVDATNVVDPTDLVALVVLPLGFVLFAPAMESSAPSSGARCAFERLAILAALPFCIATSAPKHVCVNAADVDPNTCQFTFETWTFVVNASSRDVDVSVREMRRPPASEEELRRVLCDAEPDDFLPSRTIHLRPSEALPIDADGPPGIPRVALVSLGDVFPTAVFVAQPQDTKKRVPTSGGVRGSGDPSKYDPTAPIGIGVDPDAYDHTMYYAINSNVFPLGCALDPLDAGTDEDAATDIDASTLDDAATTIDAGTDKDAGSDP